MISPPAPTLRPNPPDHVLEAISDAVTRLFDSFEDSATLIVSCASARTPAFLSIRRRSDVPPQAVIWTDRPWTAAETRIRDFFRQREIPLAKDKSLPQTSGVHQLIYSLAVPVEAVAEIVTDLLETCFLIGDSERLDFNYIRA